MDTYSLLELNMTESSPWILVGLGNPGDKYRDTRHNIGFHIIEAVSERHNITLKQDKAFLSHLGRGKIAGQSVILLMPQTFMNRSGEAVARVSRYYHSPPPKILVIVDDTALAFGRIRYRPNGSAGTHNGLRSLVAELGSTDFPRLRVGVGAPPAEWDLSDYVLGRFNPEENRVLPQLVSACADSVAYWLHHGSQKAMNQYNAWTLPSPESPNPDG